MVPLSLQRGKRMACFSSYSFCILVFYAEEVAPHVTVIPILQHRGFYFPPAANKDRAVNSMEIKDFIILWTYSQWRQALVVIPPFLSRTGNLLAPAPINSNSFFEIAFFPRCLYLHQKMYIYYFMLYLAESLTGRNYTEGKLLRYFPLWRERGTIRPQADGGK